MCAILEALLFRNLSVNGDDFTWTFGDGTVPVQMSDTTLHNA